MKLVKIMVPVLLLVMAGCGSGEKKDENPNNEIPSKEEMLGDIKKMQAELFSAEGAIADEDKAMKMIALYNDFAGFYPKEPQCPEFLFLAANIAAAIKKPKICIQNYEKILADYPDYDKNGSVKYLLAFTYDAELNNREQAKSLYESVIQSGKDTNLINDARIRLQTIDSLSYNEWMKALVSQPLPQ